MQTSRKPIGFRQLCMVARELLTDEPTIDDAEWRERIKCRIIALGFTYPLQPQTISDVMTRVEKAFARCTSTPAPPIAAPPRPRLPRDVFPRTPGAAADFTVLADVIAAMKQRGKL